MADASALAPYRALVSTAAIGHLLPTSSTTPITYTSSRLMFIRPSVPITTMVAPYVVLLDNHTANRKAGKFMAGSGKINLMKTGKAILLII